jgi:hypothetical protein
MRIEIFNVGHGQCAVLTAPSVAEIYRPWCVSYPWVGTTCAFTSFEQCMMTAGPGTGGSCAH